MNPISKFVMAAFAATALIPAAVMGQSADSKNQGYLIGKNVQANRIETEGTDETQPETKPGDCLGPRSAKVIACLQPDRRVDVEMTGTLPVVSAR